MVQVSRKEVLRQVRDFAILIIAGFIMTLIMGYTKSPRQYLIIGSFTALMWVFLWKGNSLISALISSFIDWLKSPVKSLVLLSLGSVVYTISSVLLLVKVYEWAFDIDFGKSESMVYSATVITIIITLFMHGRAFLLEWKQSALDTERLKQENVTARYESLKNQINPHFLFNSFNALTNLVYEDQDLAAKFIKQLSEVYRYVLDTRDRELVSKVEELNFLESYLFLQKIRFGDNLWVSIELDRVKTDFPPLVLQMLIENAIKHNIVSNEQPLTVKIHSANDFIVIENTLQKKKVLAEESAGVGLSNIRLRYEFLSNKKVEVEELSDKFIVRLPILKQVED
ncbi:MAG: histidine kinase [Cyclobacteriaceae bacterium]|nr:histidine kinase [Cyclobacteriaceae bacterium]